MRRGKELNKDESWGIAWCPNTEPNLVWGCRVAIPFSWAASKNHIYALSAKGHVWLREESKKFRAQLTATLRSSTKGIKIVQNKVWIDILVQKPHHKGDAVNVVDLVCDAVKDAIGIDDRWFSIRRLDWQIIKTDPKLFVGIGQEAVEASQACSHCGRILSFASFWKSRSMPSGYGRACKECSTKSVGTKSN